jgi:hypothetical protein
MEPEPHAPTPLESLLTDMVEAHETLLSAIRLQRAAIGAADPKQIASAADHLARAGTAIVALEHRRREVVVAMLRDHPLAQRPAGAQPTLRSLCPLLPDPDARRAATLADKLRAILLDVRRETRGARAATATLIAHMDGIVTQIARRLASDATYTRAGSRAPSHVLSGIDLTS